MGSYALKVVLNGAVKPVAITWVVAEACVFSWYSSAFSDNQAVCSCAEEYEERTMTTVMSVLLAVVIVSGTTQPAGVGGAWELSADTPHGKMTTPLQLKQDGEGVDGTLVDSTGQVHVMKGTMRDGTLMLESSDDWAVRARLRADGTLAGSVSMPRGDVEFIAVRTTKS